MQKLRIFLGMKRTRRKLAEPVGFPKDEILEIRDLSRGGAGVARDAMGKVVFVPFAAPGDRVLARRLPPERGEKAQYAQAELLEVLTPGPDRVPPPCPVFAKCGGCEWQHLTYARQFATKASGLKHALSRVGVAAEGVPFDELQASQIYGYRNRIQLRGQGEKLGFYERGSKRLVPIQRCEIADERLNALMPGLAQQAPAASRGEFKVEIEVLPDGSTRTHFNRGHAAGGFRQVHDGQNAKLRQWVAEHAGGGELLLDLFGGSGNLSDLPVQAFERVVVVDTSAPPSAPPGDPRVYLRRAVSASALKDVAPAKPGCATAIFDPPRIGLGPDWAALEDAVRALGVRRALLVGCDADAWARDVSRFLGRGWRLLRLGALDLFPQTSHVEGLACLAWE